VDFIISCIIICLGILGIVDAIRLMRITEPGPLFNGNIGPGSYLLVLSVGLVACGAIKVIEHYSPKSKIPTGENPEEMTVSRPLVSILMTCILYVVAMPILGYPLSSVCFFCAAYYISGRIRPWPKALLIGVFVAICFYLIFSIIIKVQLPKAWLPLRVWTF
jgi:hypothetical protein